MKKDLAEIAKLEEKRRQAKYEVINAYRQNIKERQQLCKLEQQQMDEEQKEITIFAS